VYNILKKLNAMITEEKTQRIEKDVCTNNLVRQLLDGLGFPIVVVDFTGMILYATKNTLLYNEQIIVGRLLWEYIPKVQNLQYKTIFGYVISSGVTQFLKYQEDNQWIINRFFPIFDEKGTVQYIGIFSQNVTEQTQKEELLKKTILELETAQEDERHRISRDLHDDIGQRMTALLLQLKSFNETVKNNKKIEIEEINSASLNLEIISKHLRQVFFQLYPPSLSRVSLSKVLDALCSSVEDTTGLHIDLNCQENIPDLVDNQITTVYRFVQEGLTNITKHARATSAWVNLNYSEGELNISIEDDGCGFSPQDIQEGVGLRGLRERFIVLMGNFEIETAPSKGTRLSGSFPIKMKMKKET